MTANQPACPTPGELRELAECWEDDTTTRYVSVHPARLLALADTLERQTEALREIAGRRCMRLNGDCQEPGIESCPACIAEEALRER